MGKHEEELARELQRRGMSRRDVLRIGLRMGLGAASMGLLLAACGQTASEPAKDAAADGEAAAEPASESIFDITAGDTGAQECHCRTRRQNRNQRRAHVGCRFL